MALYSALNTACQSLGLEPHSINVRNPAELDRLVMSFAGTSNGGLAVTQTASLFRDSIVEMAARYKLPVYHNAGLLEPDAKLTDRPCGEHVQHKS